MYSFGTNAKPSLDPGTAVVSLLILAGIAVALTVMVPVLVVLSLIIVPAVITLSFLVMGILAYGSLGGSGIALLFWLYKLWKEDYKMHSQGVRPEVANKLAIGEKPLEEENPEEAEKRADEEDDKPSEEDKLPEEDMLWDAVKLADEDKLPPKLKSPGRDFPLRVKQAATRDISKVWLVEQKPIGPTLHGPSTSTRRSHHIRFAMDHTKVRSIFMKEYQKIPRVGAFAYKYFTSRDKIT